MHNIKFIREPGRICDLFFIFILYFNKNLWLNNFVNISKAKSDTEFYNTVLDEFPNIPNELLIFFYMKSDSKSFLFKYYLFDLYQKLNGEYNFENVRESISDVDEFTNNLFDFYFPENKNQMDFSKKEYIDTVSDLIFESSYTDAIKHRLLAFFVNPEKNVQKLLYELVAKEALLNKYYEKNYIKTINVQEKFDFEWFAQKLNDINETNRDIKKFENINFTVTLIAKNIVTSILSVDLILNIIGYDYVDCLKMLLNRKNKLDLDAFGKVLSEKNRIAILEMLLNADELTTSDIAKNLGVSVNAAFYHLDMMTQVNMVLSHNQGRAVYYRINNNYFKDACELISKYVK